MPFWNLHPNHSFMIITVTFHSLWGLQWRALISWVRYFSYPFSLLCLHCNGWRYWGNSKPYTHSCHRWLLSHLVYWRPTFTQSFTAFKAMFCRNRQLVLFISLFIRLCLLGSVLSGFEMWLAFFVSFSCCSFHWSFRMKT